MPAPRLIDINQPLASLLDEVRPSRHVLVAVRKGHDLKKLHHLLDELAIINREVNGMIYLGDQVIASTASAPAAPARSAEVIVPTDEAEAADQAPAEEAADSEKASAKSAPTKETEDTAESKKSGNKGTTSSKKGKK